MSKLVLESKNSASYLISQTNSSKELPNGISHISCNRLRQHRPFHLPKRIYPETDFKGKKFKLLNLNSERSKKFKSCFPLFLFFCFGLFISFLSIIIAWSLSLISIKSDDANEINGGNNFGVCTSSICMQAAARLLNRNNASVDPCNDFYSFSCGNFLAKKEIPDDGFQRSTLQEMQESLLVEIKKLIDSEGLENENLGIKKARQLYSSCMHSSFRTSHYTDYKFLPIFNVLKSGGSIGNWPILQGKNWNSSEFNIEQLLASLFTYQTQSIFKIYVSPSEIDPTKYMLEFDKGEPSMAGAFYLNSSKADYVKYVRSYKRLLLESVLILSHGSPTVSADVDDILEFEKKFAELTESSKCNSDGFEYDPHEDNYGHVTIGEIYVQIPQIDWIELLQNLFDNLGLQQKVTEDMVVYFHCSEFFPNLVKLIEDTDTRVVTNYLVWRFVFRYMPYLGNKFLQIWMEFMKDVPDTNEEKLLLSRWKQCASITNDGFGHALAFLYIEKNYKDKTTERVREMIDYLKKAFKIVIKEQTWLDPNFKDNLIEKLHEMGDKIGYPSFILNSTALEREYEGLEVDEEYFLMNILKLRKFEVLKEIRKINKDVDKEKDWIILPLVANAFHNPAANEIVIPLGILRYPMFHDDYPMYLNFANLGIVIGHEMTHGFDNQGRFYDKNGNFTHWWPEEVVSSFRNQAICFTEQYSVFEMPMVGKNVNGNMTVGDNICDNSALRLSWLAYQIWEKEHGAEPRLPGISFTLPQIFYITYAQIWCEVLNKEGYEQYVRDPHSPGQFRTLGVAQNNKDFGEIFNCPSGSPMNPEQKCVLWS